MKLIVMIPAFNEEGSIAGVIQNIPRDIADEVTVMVIDDGSSDDTVSEAKKGGADYVISFSKNRGLAQAFKIGLYHALNMRGDVIVNIDADGQYDPHEIPRLIRPIIDGKADVVLGSRFKGWIEYMPRHKRIGNIIATKVTSLLAGIPISDAQTGFRAFSKEAALRLNVIAEYTYVQETIIQSVYNGLRIVEVPCTFLKRVQGQSRLISNFFDYALKAGKTIIRTYINYKPLKTFLTIGGIFSSVGLIFGLRVLIHFFKTGMVTPHLPSAILTAILLIVGFQIILLGLIADMIGVERRLMEEILYRLRDRD